MTRKESKKIQIFSERDSDIEVALENIDCQTQEFLDSKGRELIDITRASVERWGDYYVAYHTIVYKGR